MFGPIPWRNGSAMKPSIGGSIHAKDDAWGRSERASATPSLDRLATAINHWCGGLANSFASSLLLASRAATRNALGRSSGGPPELLALIAVGDPTCESRRALMTRDVEARNASR